MANWVTATMYMGNIDEAHEMDERLTNPYLTTRVEGTQVRIRPRIIDRDRERPWEGASAWEHSWQKWEIATADDDPWDWHAKRRGWNPGRTKMKEVVTKNRRRRRVWTRAKVWVRDVHGRLVQI